MRHSVSTMAKPVLVTFAAGGRQGKTGRHVSEMLLKRGVPVRAFVRTIDDRAKALRALGAEVFEGDFLDIGPAVMRSQHRQSIGEQRIHGLAAAPVWLPPEGASAPPRVGSVRNCCSRLDCSNC